MMKKVEDIVNAVQKFEEVSVALAKEVKEVGIEVAEKSENSLAFKNALQQLMEYANDYPDFEIKSLEDATITFFLIEYLHCNNSLVFLNTKGAAFGQEQVFQELLDYYTKKQRQVWESLLSCCKLFIIKQIINSKKQA